MPQLHWSPLASIVYGTPLTSAELDATANVPGTFAYTPGDGTAPRRRRQTISVAFTPADPHDFTTAALVATIDVVPATPTLTVTAPGGAFDGSPQPATVMVAGDGDVGETPAASLQDVTPTVTYYDGAGTSGLELAGAARARDLHRRRQLPRQRRLHRGPVVSVDVHHRQGGSAGVGVDRGHAGQLRPAADPGRHRGGRSGHAGRHDHLPRRLDPAGHRPDRCVGDGDAQHHGPAGRHRRGHRRVFRRRPFPAGHLADGRRDRRRGRARVVIAPNGRAAQEEGRLPRPEGGGRAAVLGVVGAHGLGDFRGDCQEGKGKKHKTTVEILGTAPLVDGSATLSFKPKKLLKKPIVVLYDGDASFLPGTSPTTILTKKALKAIART